MLYEPNTGRNLFRSRRFGLFRRLVDAVVSISGTCRILDIGGTRSYWEAFASDLEWNRVEVTIVNVRPEQERPGIHALVGDARDLSRFPDGHFDIVHSNSVIEHVGRWRDMQRMAEEVRRLAPRYFVQTPYFWFPLDPHTRVMFYHWMPDPIRYRVAMVKSCGNWKRCSTIGDAMRIADDAHLLDRSQMHYLFPEADIVRERVLGLTKSLIAIRH